ncbi:uncharacterized protein BO80DRAFT_200801 [Aspergillus ibericus CBS 121593]|uniref:Uncharacterized protein n=1 Tax=Aspergillus ibericus CBS 121593 TaxID=1448316 RepID=A0A395GSI6_9EURO|nr:hypothetical protein BO80DRAFT_200801 [Aspergillus ibericus CBS 121593]RAK97043.1 hypothetical protein BO80DRAFT_200801 [Aspergillus ibericus CBS 121593]
MYEPDMVDCLICLEPMRLVFLSCIASVIVYIQDTDYLCIYICTVFSIERTVGETHALGLLGLLSRAARSTARHLLDHPSIHHWPLTIAYLSEKLNVSKPLLSGCFQ